MFLTGGPVRSWRPVWERWVAAGLGTHSGRPGNAGAVPGTTEAPPGRGLWATSRTGSILRGSRDPLARDR